MAAQLIFTEGNLTLVPRDVLEVADTMHPAGSVHADAHTYDHRHAQVQASLHRRGHHEKMVSVKIKGYVIDELSMAKDGQGIGVSQAYLLVNGKKIILRDEKTDLLNPDGSYSIEEKFKVKKYDNLSIELYAADTVAEKDGGPNSGLVDSTIVRVTHDMKSKHKKKDSKW